MKKLVASLALATAIITPPPPSFAADSASPYISVAGAYSIIDGENGVAVTGAVGNQNEDGRVELALDYKGYSETGNLSTTSGIIPVVVDQSVLSLFVNSYLDLGTTSSGISSYLNVGAGLTRIDASVTNNNNGVKFTDKGASFAFQLGIGASKQLENGNFVDFGYRYYSTVGFEFDILGDIGDADSQDIYVGIRFPVE